MPPQVAGLRRQVAGHLVLGHVRSRQIFLEGQVRKTVAAGWPVSRAPRWSRPAFQQRLGRGFHPQRQQQFGDDRDGLRRGQLVPAVHHQVIGQPLQQAPPLRQRQPAAVGRGLLHCRVELYAPRGPGFQAQRQASQQREQQRIRGQGAKFRLLIERAAQTRQPCRGPAADAEGPPAPRKVLALFRVPGADFKHQQVGAAARPR